MSDEQSPRPTQEEPAEGRPDQVDDNAGSEQDQSDEDHRVDDVPQQDEDIDSREEESLHRERRRAGAAKPARS